jgi:predicted lipid-binding transport protein (Tim44 family)
MPARHHWLATLLLCLPAGEALARAGGGGGGGPLGKLWLVLLPILILYSAVLGVLVFHKNREARAALKKASRDPFWNPDAIQDRIEHVYFRVQEAWTKADQGLARDCLSERIFEKHRMQTDQMRAEGTRNVLEAIRLSQVKIVEIADFRDNAKDHLWAVISGSMVDYTVRESTGEIIQGRKNKAEAFQELWKFVRRPHGWVLDEIDSSVEIGDLMRMTSSVQ